MESKKRSIIKTMIWRSIGLTNGIVVTFLFLGEFSKSLGIAITANTTGLILYYIHERIWNKVKWEKQQKTISKK